VNVLIDTHLNCIEFHFLAKIYSLIIIVFGWGILCFCHWYYSILYQWKVS